LYVRYFVSRKADNDAIRKPLTKGDTSSTSYFTGAPEVNIKKIAAS
jgi:hypothetical protein